MSWLLNGIYAGLLLLLSPVIAWRMIRHGRYRRGAVEKLLGRLPLPADERPVVWFHAVSVGEVVQLVHVVAEFQKATGDQFQVVITTSTDTGFDLAVNRLADCQVTWLPLDFSWAVSNAIQRIQPRLLVLTELEFWPNLLRTCRRQNIGTAVINARMSDRSFRGYRRIRLLIRPLMHHFSVVAAQTEEYADRLRQLGARSDALTVTGSVKFDGAETDRANAATQQLRQDFAIKESDTVLIAGSTQDPEERIAIQAWQEVRRDVPGLRLIIVPRHRERFDSVADLIVRSGHMCVRRSDVSAQYSNVDPNTVILLDTIGELSACWGLADIAFVGGSFGTRGGQNMLEPAAYGAAVMVGPKTRNFREIVRQLKAADGILELAGPDDFATELRRLLSGQGARDAMGRRARDYVLSQQGAVATTVELLQQAVRGDSRVRSAA